ncbi:heavy-metal-associated domain-containing protein [Ectothiorhodospira lacustris]|uniref:heavy-metal-associated domain-containing protein n=1 Tax=Ectothiorhodospira lacustris TaxID=2899127 RepID=UPI001EE9458E|nr:heavy metal-associated domain-containing protein [Ectothiorhodospira lacustris]MCG5501444.1 heavy-metal-associated domain-containing protein [Ectothiorhodospira lacustris]MCG5509886.1 heavy-metal-associated domain-containing protein [Ectothiorhodospira lacustris]MCG5521139.1 heavy-metal-associated domain-containing protein [Ectothiorhodospira lacustris]
MSITLNVSNIQCGACANSIKKGLGQIPGVHQVAVDVAAGTVTVDADPTLRDTLAERLDELGFPERC